MKRQVCIEFTICSYLYVPESCEGIVRNDINAASHKDSKSRYIHSEFSEFLRNFDGSVYIVFEE